MMRAKLLPLCGVALVALGYLLPLWPLCVLGLALLSLFGRWAWALVLAAFLDILWGAPPFAPWMPLPFMLVAALLALARLWGRKYLFDREPMKL